MSLINDALKRAKQAQREAPPAPPSNTDLHHVETRPYARPAVSLAMPALLGVASLVLLWLLWQAARNSSAQNPLEVKAHTKAPSAEAASAAPESAPRAPSVAEPAHPPLLPGAAPQEPSAQSGLNNPPISAAFAPEPPTNAAPVAAVAPPKPALPRLQAIVSHPTRPSVIINGKTLFVGEKVGEFRVRAIDQDSVTVVGAGQTNILTLPE